MFSAIVSEIKMYCRTVQCWVAGPDAALSGRVLDPGLLFFYCIIHSEILAYNQNMI